MDELFQPARPQTSIATVSHEGQRSPGSWFKPARPQTSIATANQVECLTQNLDVSTRATADIDRDSFFQRSSSVEGPLFQPARPQTSIATSSVGRYSRRDCIVSTRATADIDRSRLALRRSSRRGRLTAFQPARPQTSIAIASTTSLLCAAFQPARPQTSIANLSSDLENCARRFVSTRATANIDRDALSSVGAASVRRCFNPRDRRHRSRRERHRRPSRPSYRFNPRDRRHRSRHHRKGGNRRFRYSVSTRATADNDRDISEPHFGLAHEFVFQPARPQTTIATACLRRRRDRSRSGFNPRDRRQRSRLELPLDRGNHQAVVSTRATADNDRDNANTAPRTHHPRSFNPRDRRQRSLGASAIAILKFQPARPQTTIATRYSRVEAIRLAFVSTRATADINRDIKARRFTTTDVSPFQPARPQTSIATKSTL